MFVRAVFVVCAVFAFAGCSLVVSTTGLTGEQPPADAAADRGSAQASDAREAATLPPPRDAEDGGADALAEADAPDDRALWPVNGHRYEVRIYPSAISWTAARDDAAMSGGHLATITSADEDGFVASILVGRTVAFDGAYGPWIGAYQPDPAADDGGLEPAGGWAWVTDEPWSYTDWNAGEPNNSGDVEQYAHYYDSEHPRWNDVSESGDQGIRSAVIEYE